MHPVCFVRGSTAYHFCRFSCRCTCLLGSVYFASWLLGYGNGVLARRGGFGGVAKANSLVCLEDILPPTAICFRKGSHGDWPMIRLSGGISPIIVRIWIGDVDSTCRVADCCYFGDTRPPELGPGSCVGQWSFSLKTHCVPGCARSRT